MRLHSEAGLVFARPSTAEYRETAPPTSHLGTGADTGPSAFFATGLSAALPHFGLTHVEPDRVVHDPDHDRVRVDPAAAPRATVFLLELGAEYNRNRAIPQLQQLRLELRVRLVQQPLIDNEAWRA